MENQITIISQRNAYLRQFQIAQLNLAMFLEEERLVKQSKGNRVKRRRND